MTENLTTPPRRQTPRKPLILSKSTGLNEKVCAPLPSPTCYNEIYD